VSTVENMAHRYSLSGSGAVGEVPKAQEPLLSKERKNSFKQDMILIDL